MKTKKVNGVSIYDIAENPKLLTGIEDDLQFIVQACVVKMIKGIDVEVICDSARPEAIQFLRENNINATSCIKGKGQHQGTNRNDEVYPHILYNQKV